MDLETLRRRERETVITYIGGKMDTATILIKALVITTFTYNFNKCGITYNRNYI